MPNREQPGSNGRRPTPVPLSANFGDFALFRAHMIEAASTIQGSRWALASWEPTGRRVVIEQAHDHQGNHGQGTVPILAIDPREHAYYLQYANDKRAFFDAIWAIVAWPRVADRLDQASLDTPARPPGRGDEATRCRWLGRAGFR